MANETEVKKVKRQVALRMVVFNDVHTDVLGNKVAVTRTADQWEEIELPETEAQRLDELGALVPEDSSRSEVEQQQADTGDRIRAEQGDREALGRVMARALNPLDRTAPVPDSATPTPSVSPPSLGVEPIGDFTKGDTGDADSPAIPGALSGETDVRADAPDPASADVGEIAAFITSEKLNADETVALAGDDPQHAQKVLEAERIAASEKGGDPRATVESRLQKIAEQQ